MWRNTKEVSVEIFDVVYESTAVNSAIPTRWSTPNGLNAIAQ
jgi:hypothetical protein